MTADLRKCISLGPSGTSKPGTYQDYRVGRHRTQIAATGTRWIRLWVDWCVFQPHDESTNGPPNVQKPTLVTELRDQLLAARNDGLKIILTTWNFPFWVNPDNWAEMTAKDRPFRPQPKDWNRCYVWPDDLSTTGPYARWLDWLLGTYGSLIDALEIINEPNMQCQPQATSTGGRNAPCKVALMFSTALAVRNRRGTHPLLVGPATVDTIDNSGDYGTEYGQFTQELLAFLNAFAFNPGAHFVWSQHSYADQERDLGSNGREGLTRAQKTRLALVGRWIAWPNQDPDEPHIWLTEGGVRSANARLYHGDGSSQKQADLVRRNWDRMNNNSDGVGIWLTTNYLYWDAIEDPTFDTGLSPPDLGGGAAAPKPLHYTWKSFPSRQ